MRRLSDSGWDRFHPGIPPDAAMFRGHPGWGGSGGALNSSVPYYTMKFEGFQAGPETPQTFQDYPWSNSPASFQSNMILFFLFGIYDTIYTEKMFVIHLFADTIAS